MSVKNFSPELMNIFKVGSQREFQFNCGSAKAAQALRARLHNLRREMRKERHWLTSVAESVVISIPKDKSEFIVAHPPDNDILGNLRQALKEQGGEEIEKEYQKEEEKFFSDENPNEAMEAFKKGAKLHPRDTPDKVNEAAEHAIHDYLKDYRKPRE